MKDDFFRHTLESLRSQISSQSLPAYIGDQIWQWVYQKMVLDPDRWSNIAKMRRVQLQDFFSFALPQLVHLQTDDMGTKKALLRLGDGQQIECVHIPERGHVTFCISSQVGCPLGCRFCATGQMGFRRNLTVSEIVAQVYIMKQQIVPFSGKLNLVFMGMGEPLLNREALFTALEVITSPQGLAVSQKNITVSTAGILDGIDALLNRFPAVKLSLSLNGFDARSRQELMPVNAREPIEPILERLRRYRSRNRITFEYVLIPGVNDAPQHAHRLVSWIRGIPCKVNLIPFNPFPGAPYGRPEASAVDGFAALLFQKNLTVVVRWSKGGDIAAACGQLAGRANHEQSPV